MRTAFACPWLHAEKINIEKRKILKIKQTFLTGFANFAVRT